jgi:multiple sugar transport system substrate-binding protein
MAAIDPNQNQTFSPFTPPSSVSPAEKPVSAPEEPVSADPGESPLDLAPTIPPPSLFENAQVEKEEPQTPPVQPPNPPPTQAVPPPKPKSSRVKKILIIVIGLGIFLILTLVLIKFFPSISNISFSGKVELTWWGLWEDETIIAPIIEEYEKDHPKVKITYIAQSKEDYRERLVNSLAQGKGPDIFRFHNTWVPMFKNVLAPLPSEIMSPQEFESTFYPVAVKDLTTSAGLVGIPLMYDGLGLFINEEIFATHGKTLPKTWDDLRETAISLTIKDQAGIIKQAGVAIGRADNVDHWQEILSLMMIQNGVDLTNISKNPELAQGALAYYTSFSNTYKIWDETLPPSTAYFATGKLAMYFAPSWRAIEIIDQNPDLKFKVIPPPQLPKSDSQEPDITYATYWVEGVSSESKFTQEAWEFLKYLSSRETLEKFYERASQADPRRRFGEPYPRQDMKDLLLNDPIVGGIVKLAPSAQSWYLASRTFDGETGINSRLSAYLGDAVNLSATRGDRGLQESLNTVSSGFQQVLSDYGLVAPPPVEE